MAGWSTILALLVLSVFGAHCQYQDYSEVQDNGSKDYPEEYKEYNSAENVPFRRQYGYPRPFPHRFSSSKSRSHRARHKLLGYKAIKLGNLLESMQMNPSLLNHIQQQVQSMMGNMPQYPQISYPNNAMGNFYPVPWSRRMPVNLPNMNYETANIPRLNIPEFPEFRFPNQFPFQHLPTPMIRPINIPEIPNIQSLFPNFPMPQGPMTDPFALSYTDGGTNVNVNYNPSSGRRIAIPENVPSKDFC